MYDIIIIIIIIHEFHGDTSLETKLLGQQIISVVYLTAFRFASDI